MSVCAIYALPDLNLSVVLCSCHRGALLTHKNFIAAASSMKLMAASQKFFIPTPADTHISYLPLAHCFERLCQSIMIAGAAKIGYYQGNYFDISYIDLL